MTKLEKRKKEKNSAKEHLRRNVLLLLAGIGVLCKGGWEVYKECWKDTKDGARPVLNPVVIQPSPEKVKSKPIDELVLSPMPDPFAHYYTKPIPLVKPEPLSKASYLLSVTVSADKDSETDDNLQVSFYGDENTTRVVKLETAGINDLERGRTYLYKFDDMKYIGSLRKMVFELKKGQGDKGDHLDDVFLVSVRLQDLTNNTDTKWLKIGKENKGLWIGDGPEGKSPASLIKSVDCEWHFEILPMAFNK